MRLIPYRVARLMCEVRYAGMWFRVGGERLFITGNTADLDPAMQRAVKRCKPQIIAALQTLPPACRYPTVHLLIGRCDSCQPESRREAA